MTTFAISALLCLVDALQGFCADDNPDLSRKGAEAAVGRRCASCHTDTFAGTKAVARIAGQREEYLFKALHDYKSGVRSVRRAAMADVAYPLSDEEITRCRITSRISDSPGRQEIARGTTPAVSHTPSDGCRRCAASAPAPSRIASRDQIADHVIGFNGCADLDVAEHGAVSGEPSVVSMPRARSRNGVRGA